MRGSLDHVMFACSNLEGATDAFEAAGFAPTYGGEHRDTPTEMALVPFEDGTYLELVAPTDSGEPPAAWPDGMFDAGICRWCVAVDDIQAESDRLAAEGATVNGPAERSRERHDGATIEYAAAVYGLDSPFMTFPFLISDLTPRRRRADPSNAEEGPLTGLKTVVIAVADLDDAITTVLRLHDLPDPQRTDHRATGADLARFPGTPIVLASPGNEDAWPSERLPAYEGWPCATLVGTRNLDEAADVLDLGVPTAWFGTHLAWVDLGDLPSRVGVIEI